MHTIDTESLRLLLLDRAGYLVLGAVFLSLGAVMIPATLMRRGPRYGVLILFGVMSLLWGLRFLCRAPLVPLLVGGSPEFWHLFARGLTYASAPAGVAVMGLIFGPGWRGTLRVFTWVTLAFAVVAIALLLLKPDPDLMIHPFNVLVLVGGAVIGAAVLQPEHRRRRDLRVLMVASLVSLAIIVRENLRSLGVQTVHGDAEWMAAVVLYGALGYLAARHVVGAELSLAALRQELDTARRIQEAILPPGPPRAPRLAVAARYLPMTEVAGDLYDFAELEDGRTGVLVADVSGHGVAAALVSSMTKVAFQAQAAHHDDPARVLAGMNRMLGTRLDGKFVTAAYVCLDAAAGTLRYAGAGHPPLVLARGRGGVQTLEANGLMMGVLEDTPYGAVAANLEPGDRILLHTDGIVEAFNEKEEDYGDERLQALLAATMDLPVEACAERIVADVKAWVGTDRGRILEDDVTLVLVEVLGAPDLPLQAQGR